jgi:molecular chaperone GrpE (heat shock protein)
MGKDQSDVKRHLDEIGVTGEEFDAAVDEAMEHVRRREQ